jgi:[acyl-carrier-protein] S-malonyltransferase
MIRYCIVCSGQGSMGVDSLDFSKPFISTTNVIDLFSSEFGWDLFSVENGELDLRLNKFSQPLTIATSIANWTVLKEYLPAPTLFMGYSAGEVSALGCAQDSNLSQIAKLTHIRCKTMEDFSPSRSGLLAIKGINKIDLLELIDNKSIYIAIINAYDHFIVGGSEMELILLEDLMYSRGTWYKRLNVSVPSHTPLLKSATVQFLSEMNNQSYSNNDLHLPIVQGINGMPSNKFDIAIKSIGNAISQTIYWNQCMQFVIDSGVNVVLELGPGNSLSKLFTEFSPSISARSVSDFRTPEGVRNWLLSQPES